MQEFVHKESLPFSLIEESAKRNIIFISQSHTTLEELNQNITFLGGNVLTLAPRFSFFTNHEGLNNFEFLKNYIKSFEKQAKITLIHSSLLFIAMPEPDSFTRLILKKGQNIDMTQITKDLVKMGYSSVSTVFNAGEFAVRGYILDFATTDDAIRIEFSGNKIEEVKTFDVETQKSLNKIEQIEISPNRFITEVDVSLFKARYKIKFQEENPQLFNAIEHHPESCDINKYAKLLLKDSVSIMEILSGDVFLHNFTMESYINSMKKEFKIFENQLGVGAEVLYNQDVERFSGKAKVVGCV